MTRAELRQEVIDNTARRDKVTLINNSLNFAQKEIVKLHDFRDMRRIVDLYVAAGSDTIAMPGTVKKFLGVWVMDVIATVPATFAGAFVDNEPLSQFKSGDGDPGFANFLYSASDDTSITLIQYADPVTTDNNITGTTSGAIATPTGDAITYTTRTDPLVLKYPGNALDVAVDAQYLTPRRPCNFAFIFSNAIKLTAPADRKYTVRTNAIYGATDMTTDADTPSVPGSDEALIAYACSRVMRSMQRMNDANAWLSDFTALVQNMIEDDNRNPGENIVAGQTGMGMNQSGFSPTSYLDPFQLTDNTRRNAGGW